MIITEKAENRIREMIYDTDKCIEYDGSLSEDGYGLIQSYFNGKKIHMLTHRISYQIYNNYNLTSEELVCHHCDNPKCINPRHLFKGTQNDNVQDKVRKGRQAKGNKHGRYIDGRCSDHKIHHIAKHGSLEEYQVLKIRELKNKGEKLLSISKILSIPYQTIKDISCGRTYKNII